jgi:hypothetical protein
MRPLTEKEVAQYLEVFDLREKLISRLAIFEGLRPGEILALRWKSLEGEILRVEQRVYKRVLDTPKNGKTREGAISDGTLALITEWADLAEDPSPDGFVFPSEKLTTPLSLDNLWRRYMYPKLETSGLEWATFQVLRKTNASLSKKAGVDPKVASDQRGHGLGVSMEVYTNSDLEQKRAALKKLEAAVLRKPQPESQVASAYLAQWSKRNNEESVGLPKLLKSWSGRPGSNRRRPAWEYERRKKIKTMAPMTMNTPPSKSATSETRSDHAGLMEWKWSGELIAGRSPPEALFVGHLHARWHDL